jgi:hypothetical protein
MCGEAVIKSGKTVRRQSSESMRILPYALIFNKTVTFIFKKFLLVLRFELRAYYLLST